MSLMRIKTEGERGKDGGWGWRKEKRGGKGWEAIRWGFAQPLAMTNWSNYAWRLWHWLWHHPFCWSVQKQTCSIIQYNIHKQIHASSLPPNTLKDTEHYFDLVIQVYVDVRLASVSVSQHQQVSGRSKLLCNLTTSGVSAIISLMIPFPISSTLDKVPHTRAPSSLFTALFDTWVQISSVMLERHIDFRAEQTFDGANLYSQSWIKYEMFEQQLFAWWLWHWSLFEVHSKIICFKTWWCFILDSEKMKEKLHLY